MTTKQTDGVQERDIAQAEEISEGELLAFIHDHGYDSVTERKLERWYREEECLPRPRQAHLPGTRGSCTLYPAVAAPQLLALCQLMGTAEGKRPNFDALRVSLWIQRYSIPIERVRASIETLTSLPLRDMIRKANVRFRDLLEMAEYLARLVLPRLKRTVFGQFVSQRLPNPTDQLSFLTMQMQLFLGDQPAFDSIEEYIDSDETLRDKSLSELIRDAYGLDRAQTDSFLDAKPWLPRDLTPDLANLAKRGLLSWRRQRRQQTLQNATVQDLERARAEREAFFTIFPRMVRGMEAIGGENVFGFGMFRLMDDLMPSSDAWAQATQVLILLIVREAGMGEGLDHILATIREQAPIWDHNLALLAALREELPEAADALTCDIRIIRTQAAFEQRLAELRAFSERNRVELEAFWARHPELYDVPFPQARDQIEA